MTIASPSGAPRIVVGVDGSEQSKQALRWAGYMAASMSADIEVVGAWQRPDGVGETAPLANWHPAADAEHTLEAAVDSAFGAQRPAGLRTVAREGHPATILLERSVQAAMLVVGSRGHGGFAGQRLGSVSSAVAEHATCPVLVIHGDRVPPRNPLVQAHAGGHGK